MLPGQYTWHMQPKHILVVDDDPEIRQLLSAYLGQSGYRVSTARDGQSMWALLGQDTIDLIILDLMMPADDGLDLCRQLQSRYPAPVIMLTARNAAVDRIVGLEIGADDYVTKPFDPRELLARTKAVLRRAGERPQAGAPSASAGSEPEYLAFAGWKLDMRARQLESPEQLIISLPNSDFHVLRSLLLQPNRPLSREYLVRQAFGRPLNNGDRAIDVCISRLRQHLEHDSRHPVLLRTIRNEGYMIHLDSIGKA